METSMSNPFFAGLVGIFKILMLLLIFSPIFIYRSAIRNKDRKNGIDPDAIEKQERAKKEKEEHDKYFKGQGY